MAQHIILRPIDSLMANPHNARKHSERQITQLAELIKKVGFLVPISTDPEGGVIAGHGRLLAAQRLGMTQVPVIILDHLTEAEKRAYMIADNQLTLAAEWDEDLLREQLADLQKINFDIDMLGFADDELKQLLDVVASGGLADEDALPPIPETPVTRTGDLWLLDSHRLLCGDATVGIDVERLLPTELVDLVFTDPPWGVGYEGYTQERLKMQGDEPSEPEFLRLLESSCLNLRSIMKPEASLYICHPSSRQREFQNALEAAGLSIRTQIIWAKNTFAWGFSRYKFSHEPIFYCHVAGEKDAWYGDKTQSTLWEENKPFANRTHPTAKPVELLERALINSSKPGDVVADLFGGSGSTLIACERLRRKARLMEIDPRYADSIVTRWQDYTGKRAVLDGDGRSFFDISRERLQTQD